MIARYVPPAPLPLSLGRLRGTARGGMRLRLRQGGDGDDDGAGLPFAAWKSAAASEASRIGVAQGAVGAGTQRLEGVESGAALRAAPNGTDGRCCLAGRARKTLAARQFLPAPHYPRRLPAIPAIDHHESS